MSAFYEAGRYACKVTNQALGEAKTGTPQFILQFTVMGKVDPSDPSRYIPAAEQYERTCFRAITDKTIPYLMDDLQALGFHGSSFRDLDPESPNFQDFRGRDIDMRCVHEKDQQGQDREKWSIARQGGGKLEVKPLEPKKLRDLDNLFGKELKKLATAPAPAPRADPAATISDDDVPF